MSRDEDELAHSHRDGALCEAALQLYAEALSTGRIARAALESAPCLTEMALLHPDPQDSAWMLPVPPSSGLAHLLQPLTQEIHERVRIAASLTEALAPLASIASADPNLAITVLEGRPLIESAIADTTRGARQEILTLQPGSTRPPEQLQLALTNARSTLDRSIPLRHIYQHSARYSPELRSYVGQIPAGILQVRTLEQTIERLLIFDRAVAFIPATPDRDVALKIRHPALVRYFVQVYEVLWTQATPLTENLPTTTPGASVTAVQLSIARLLVEGHVDEIVARKLGISVRTCRAHISRLMRTLNASSRTQLGARLIQSGMVDEEPRCVP
ncbi:LuxR C-terminal-related transcriptional regulator [Streptomyces sp. NPDC058439]|uniref:helix-turn-helix transcriptional regulator n=1 Tax=Streptomyces sp. NPDC058439 TaxID=3346500 RepID=UPI00364A4BB7